VESKTETKPHKNNQQIGGCQGPRIGEEVKSSGGKAVKQYKVPVIR